MPMPDSTVLFRRIDTKRRGLMVAEQILEAIHRGLLKVGDRLPPERDLAEQTGVSRPSVREAIAALQLAGVVETNPGEGTFITDSARDVAFLASVLSDFRQSAELSEVLGARRVLEKAAADLIISRGSANAISRLRAPLEALRESGKQRDFDAYDRANTEFHAGLIQATGNSVLERAVLPIVNITLGNFARRLKSLKFDAHPEFFDSNFTVHQAIYDAIVREDLNGLLKAIDRHYEVLSHSLQ